MQLAVSTPALSERVNQQRGSLKPVLKGQTFTDAVKKWRTAIAPNLSPATVRPRESYLRKHITPALGHLSLLELDVSTIQQFATDLRKTLSGKTVVNVLGTVFTILDYAERCGMKMPKVGFTDLQLGSTTREHPVAFFTRDQAHLSLASPANRSRLCLPWLGTRVCGQARYWRSLSTTSTSTVGLSGSINPRTTARVKPGSRKQSARWLCCRCRAPWKPYFGITCCFGNQTPEAFYSQHGTGHVRGVVRMLYGLD